MINGQIKLYDPHYQGAQGVVPSKIRVQPRDAFKSLPATSRSVVDGSVASPSWSQQRLLAELDNQLVSVCGGSLPRVFDGTNWRTYPNNAVLTQKLSQQVLHTSQRTIQAPDSAWMSGVTCAVWTESTPTSTGALTTSFIGFKGDNGAWLVKPTPIYASNSVFVTAQAKVVTDGANFFVFWSNLTSIVINAYDVNGAFLGTSSAIPLPLHTSFPGMWDITAATSTGGYTVLCAVLQDGTSNAGINLYAVKWNGAAIVVNAVAIGSGTISANYRVSFLRNDTGNGLSYLATTIQGGGAIWAYEITNQAVTHTYNTAVTVASNAIDSITGYVVTGTLAVVLSYSTLVTFAHATGPKYDPQYRYMASFQTDRSNVSTQLRVTQSMAQSSRAFPIDGNYYSLGYYQSGSGNVLIQTKANVTNTAGDFMIGAATQPVTVVAGDSTEGSPITAQSITSLVGPTVSVTASHTSLSITGPDAVNVFTASGLSSVGIPNGTQMLKWTFAALSASSASYTGSRLVVAGSSIAAANSTWDVVFTIGNDFITPLNDIFLNATVPSGTFSGAGGQSFSLTSMVAYEVAPLNTILGSDTVGFFIGGALKVTGSSFGNNVSAAPILRVNYGQAGPNYFGGSIGTYALVWVAFGSQSTHIDTFTATISPQQPNQWKFANGLFDSTYVGADLVVSANPLLPANIGTFPITSVTSGTALVTGGATALLPQTFIFPVPTVSIQLTTQVPYTFKLQSITPDYTYQNALVLVQGGDPVNNGTYRIVQINADGTFVALPTNGLSNQVNEALTGAQTITIFFAPNNEPAFQSTWFLVPMTGTQPVAGRFESGLAYADWRIEGDQTAGIDLFPNALVSVYSTLAGTQFVLPYRAQNVTSSVTQITAAGQVDIGDATFSSTVGLKQFLLGSANGHAYANAGELLVPGPMASVFTASGFFEDNVNVAPEAPFLVSQSVAGAGQLGVTLGSVRIYVMVWEQTDENGNRIYSPPSPALVVNMSGANNVATIGGRLAFPLSSTGTPVANTYGPTCRNVTGSLYATAFINGVPTTQRFKITSDLDVNGLAPISATNPSGFSFPDSFTWNYIDQNPDSQITPNEILYTDKGYLPRFPSPAFSSGVGSWCNREWVIGYDGAIWMSGEKTEGDAIWFNPAFRYVLPTDDKPIGLAALEDYLIVLCSQSVWYIPKAQFPDATGQNGGLPTPVRLPFPNGSVSGLAQTIREGVAYDSTAGGVWLVTRNLDNIWLSHDVLDSLATPVVDLALDAQQRLFVLQQSGPIMVYDGVPAAWYAWQAPTVGVLLANYSGQVVYQDSATVNVVTPGQAADLIAGVTTGIAPDITLAPLNLGNVRGLKRVWEFQAVGTYLGPHRLNVVLSYPEDVQPNTVFGPFVALAGVPYVYSFNPLLEEAAQFGIRVYADFVGVGSPGLTFALEMISAQVGLDSAAGLKKLPPNVQLVGA